MDIPEFSINKSTKIWQEFFGLKNDDELQISDKNAICRLVLPTSSGGNKAEFCERTITNHPDMSLFHDKKFVLLTKTCEIKHKKLLLYYVELNPVEGVNIYEASNEGTALENFVTEKFGLPAFSVYNATGLDYPLKKQAFHMAPFEKQSSGGRLIKQAVVIRDDERMLFKPVEREFSVDPTPVILLLESTFKGKYKVIDTLEGANDFVLKAVDKYVSR